MENQVKVLRHKCRHGSCHSSSDTFHYGWTSDTDFTISSWTQHCSSLGINYLKGTFLFHCTCNYNKAKELFIPLTMVFHCLEFLKCINKCFLYSFTKYVYRYFLSSSFMAPTTPDNDFPLIRSHPHHAKSSHSAYSNNQKTCI